MNALDKPDSLAEYTEEIGKEAMVIASGAPPIVALVVIESGDLESVSLSTRSQFLELIERSRTRQRAKGGIASEEMRCRLRGASP